MARSPLLIVVAAVLFVMGCDRNNHQPETITLATTTSTQDSGLLNVLLPKFERQAGIKVNVIAVGSGQALELGRRGDADVLLTHSPEAEEKFMADEFGSERYAVMHNDFVIVGPTTDAAEIKGTASAADALRRIANKKALYVSRGDESGTHQKEKSLWADAGIKPQGWWYISVGTGMAQAIRIADEKRAYLLTDRATFLTTGNQVSLEILVEGDPKLKNPYSIIVISQRKHPHLNQVAAQKLAQFFVSHEGQTEIAKFVVERFKQPIFFPDAGQTD